MIVKLLTDHHLESLGLKGGCKGLSESTLVKCQIDGNIMSRLICDSMSVLVNKMICVSSMDSGQPGKFPSLTSLCIVCKKQGSLV